MMVSSTSMPANRSRRVRIFSASICISVPHLTEYLPRFHAHRRSLHQRPLDGSLTFAEGAFVARVAGQKVILQYIRTLGKEVINRKQVGDEPGFKAVVSRVIGETGLIKIDTARVKEAIKNADGLCPRRHAQKVDTIFGEYAFNESLMESA